MRYTQKWLKELVDKGGYMLDLNPKLTLGKIGILTGFMTEGFKIRSFEGRCAENKHNSLKLGKDTFIIGDPSRFNAELVGVINIDLCKFGKMFDDNSYIDVRNGWVTKNKLAIFKQGKEFLVYSYSDTATKKNYDNRGTYGLGSACT